MHNSPPNTPPASLITAYGPHEVATGTPFNAQPDGSNALWFLLQESRGTFSVEINGTPLNCALDRAHKLLSVRVPPWLTEFPGELVVAVHNESLSGLPIQLKIPVTAATTFEPPTVAELQHRYLAVQQALHHHTRKPEPTFLGWGMSTIHRLPWEFGVEGALFQELSHQLARTFCMSPSTGMTPEYLQQLLWRHWNVLKATKLAFQLTAANFTDDEQRELVECGVGDGITAFWSLHAARSFLHQPHFRLWLFDAWEGMHDGAVDEDIAELTQIYDDLDVNRTRANLRDFAHHATFVRGRIPGSLTQFIGDRTKVMYLHIDLNHAAATRAALEFFIPEMPVGAVVLFDDFGWEAYASTRATVLEYLTPRMGEFLLLPTGQALFVKGTRT
jgi:hypothetical protein